MHVDFAPGRGPEPTEKLEAQADLQVAPIGAPAAVPSPFTNTARDISSLLSEGWESETICWTPEACITTSCDEVVCEPCAPPEIVEENLGEWPMIKACASCRPFTFGSKLRYADCHDPGQIARRVVDAAVGKNLARGLHNKLVAIGKPVNNDKCVCAETAVGLLEQSWEANQTGEPWYSVPSMLKGHLISSGLLQRVGARWTLCGQPALVGGMGPGGPVGTETPTECAYLWVHGPVDYALGRYKDKSFRHDTGNAGFQNVKRFGLVRVDPCGVGAVPVSLKCGGC